MKRLFCRIFLMVATVSAWSKENPFWLDKVFFNSELIRFEISWHADSSAIGNDLEYGITISRGAPGNERPLSTVKLTKLKSDTVLTISDLTYDAEYYVEIWGRSDVAWINPDSQSRQKMLVSSVSRQPVSLFDPTKVNDTVRIFGDRIICWKDSDYSPGKPVPPYKDTVLAFSPPDSLLKGFVKFGFGIRFAHPEPNPPFHIEFSLDSIPSKYLPGQIHIYRDSVGLLIPEDSSFFDRKTSRISMTVKKLELPLIVLADTVAPTVKILSGKSTVIDSNTLYDTILVSDNSANMSWAFYYAPGAEQLKKPYQTGILKGKSGRVVCPISPVGAQENGIRAAFICSDCAFIDTVNLSKRGVRLHSDPFTIPQKIITPLYTTAQLDNPSIDNCFKPLFDKSQGKYDKSKFRLYRWLLDKSNAGLSNKWIEYSSDNKKYFSLTPGILIWLINSESGLIDFGKGTTLSLGDTVSIPLPAHEWSDFNNPFGFNLKFKDVFNASSLETDDLLIYKWVEDRKNHTYRTSLVYGGISSLTDSLHDTLYALQNGYTVYNRSDSAAVLRLPPVPYCSTGSMEFLKKEKNESVLVRIGIGKGNEEYESVYCGIHGNRRDTLWYPLPPTFGTHELAITNLREKDPCGIVSLPFAIDSPAVFSIDISCNKDIVAVDVYKDIVKNDFGYDLKLYAKGSTGIEPFNGTRFLLHNGKGTLVLAAGKTESIDLFQKSNKTHAALKPTVSFRCIRGAVGMEIRDVEQSTCNIEIFTLQGKRMAIYKFFHASGKSRLLLPMKLPDGAYLINVKFTNRKSIVFSTIKEFSFINRDK